MSLDPEKIKALSERLELLLRRQDQLQAEVSRLRREMDALKQDPAAAPTSPAAAAGVPPPPSREAPAPGRKPWGQRLGLPAKTRQGWETFIGENLISKIGILITVIGVAFGAKYAIDHQLISPLTRIVLGYLAGAGLLALAIRLKERYEAFSAVLLSGALAVLYIITYFAYRYYSLMPQPVAFGLMVLFTAFAVLAAWRYDRQVIALMGLVGAYGVPFLLSEDAGQVQVLFTYMVIINAGILAISFRKYWKLLFHAAFWLTWLIFSWWMAFGYDQGRDIGTGLLFVSLFFLLFYGTFLAYKLQKKQAVQAEDLVLLLANSFTFFGFGYLLLDDHPTGAQLLGVFAVINAAVHLLAGRLIRRLEPGARNLFYVVAGLVLVFLTLAVPIQLDGNWVTLLWVAEAALLLWLGRRLQIPAYERMSLPLLVLAFGSLVQDWSTSYLPYFYPEQAGRLTPVWNIQLLSSLLFVALLGLMNVLQQHPRLASALPGQSLWRQGLRFAVPGLFILGLYYAFRLEIEYYWQLRSYVETTGQTDLPHFRLYTYSRLGHIWVVVYSLFFLLLLSLANLAYFRQRILAWTALGLTAFGVLAFLVIGLYELSGLRADHLASMDAGDPVPAYGYLRYLAYAVLAALLWVTYRHQRQPFAGIGTRWPFDLLLHLSALWVASSELIHWMDLRESRQAYKLGLSILWGCYALLLISLGIAHRKVYLRVGAIALFALTLLKLFFYDIAHLNTVAKTIVLLALGALLLVISFLYNKFKHLIVDETNA